MNISSKIPQRTTRYASGTFLKYYLSTTYVKLLKQSTKVPQFHKQENNSEEASQ